jgi:sirohydrochlorin ferrochelatase
LKLLGRARPSLSERDRILPVGISEQTLGIVIVDHGSRRAESNALFERFASLFAHLCERGIVEPAHMEFAEPSLATAILRCAERGADRIVVAPYFLAPGKHWREDLPRLTSEAAAAARAATGKPLQWLVGQPIGLDESVVRLVDARVEHCLRRAQGEAEACEACAGSDRCRFEDA